MISEARRHRHRWVLPVPADTEDGDLQRGDYRENFRPDGSPSPGVVCCPECGSLRSLAETHGITHANGEWPTVAGEIACGCGARYRIEKGLIVYGDGA